MSIYVHPSNGANIAYISLMKILSGMPVAHRSPSNPSPNPARCCCLGADWWGWSDTEGSGLKIVAYKGRAMVA